MVGLPNLRPPSRCSKKDTHTPASQLCGAGGCSGELASGRHYLPWHASACCSASALPEPWCLTARSAPITAAVVALAPFVDARLARGPGTASAAIATARTLVCKLARSSRQRAVGVSLLRARRAVCKTANRTCHKNQRPIFNTRPLNNYTGQRSRRWTI